MKRFLPALVGLLLIAAFIELGLWQLRRAAFKEQLEAAFRLREQAVPVRATAHSDWVRAKSASPQRRYLHVQTQGRYDSAHQFLLDNQTYEGQVGYQVYTPLLLRPGGPAVLVDRGWIWMGQSRETLPDVAVGSGTVKVTGFLSVPVVHAFLLGASGYHAKGWPRVVEKIDPRLASEELGYRVAPMVLLLSPSAPNGYVRHWEAYVGLTPTRHKAYAFQWFSMAFAVLVLMVWLPRRRRRAARRGSEG